jgi:hypothetical protein
VRIDELGYLTVGYVRLCDVRFCCVFGWWAVVNAVMNLRVPWNAGNFLTSWGPVSFSGRTLVHGVIEFVKFLSVCFLIISRSEGACSVVTFYQQPDFTASWTITFFSVGHVYVCLISQDRPVGLYDSGWSCAPPLRRISATRTDRASFPGGTRGPTRVRCVLWTALYFISCQCCVLCAVERGVTTTTTDVSK